jgi:hypothetical protein
MNINKRTRRAHRNLHNPFVRLSVINKQTLQYLHMQSFQQSVSRETFGSPTTIKDYSNANMKEYL